MHNQITKPATPCLHCGVPTFNPRFCSLACVAFQRWGTAESRFWRKVNKTDSCWLWTGGKAHFGYGKFFASGASSPAVRAHRFSWELHNGTIPDGLLVLHNCPGGDNPACVNPAHLWLGSYGDNAKDAAAKGRLPNAACGFHVGDLHYTRTNPELALRGEACGNATMTEPLVLEIRRRCPPERCADLAREFSVTPGAIWSIVNRRTWKHLP